MSRRGVGAGARQVGTTLIEVLTALAIGTIVTSSLYLLVGTTIKARLIVTARVSDQERARLALAWLSDRIRQVNTDPQAACPEGVLRAGHGTTFAQRLAFRAVVDESLDPARRTYAYYLENQTLWQETLVQESPDQCTDEIVRSLPDPGRGAILPSTVRAFRLIYLDTAGSPTADPVHVRLIRISLTVQATGASGRPEAQTYETTVALRGP